MNENWRQFLDNANATVGADDAVTFADAPAVPECALADLSYLGLIRIAGEDTRTFLQGQVTNDIRKVTPDHYQLNSICSPKGRMLASFLVFERAGDIYLQLPRTRLDAILKRLQMFVLRSQVTLSDASDELVRVGIAGTCADTLLPEVPPSAPGSVLDLPPLTLIRAPGERPRYEIVGPPAAVQSFWEESVKVAQPAHPDFWPLMDIRAGIPTVCEETVEAFVPQMANMQLIDGVSFHKGCYTGQEIVARMQYLGKLKRRMYLAHVTTDTAPKAGDELYSPGCESGQGAGRVVDARPSPDGGYELLAVAEIAAAETSTLSLGDAHGPTLTFRTLPYATDSPA